MKNTVEEIKSRLDDTEEWIRSLEYRVVKITEAEQKRKKKEKKEKRIIKWNEDSLRDLWYNIKFTNIHIIGVSEEEKEEENVFEDIIAENSPNGHPGPGNTESSK